MELLVAL